MYERACGFCGDLWRGGPGIARPSLGIDLKFCGRACLKSWEAKLTFSTFEIEAIEKMLPDVGQHVASTGLGDKPFNACSREEILGLMAVSVRSFRTALQAVMDREGIAF